MQKLVSRSRFFMGSKAKWCSITIKTRTYPGALSPVRANGICAYIWRFQGKFA